MSEPVKLALGLLAIFLFIRSIYINIAMTFARRKACKHPTEQNALRAFRLLNAKLGVSITNHPREWAKYRDMFYHINKSSDVPSELKEKLKKRLVKKGLYIDNVRIIDNYKGDSRNV